MAQRPVFVPGRRKNSPEVFWMEFVWNGGFAASQKQKNIVALHEAFTRRFPEKKVLEISSMSMEPLGVQLSAFNLTKYVPELGRSVPLECVFQGGKVFAAGGPYRELYAGTAREAKKDPRLKSSGILRAFRFDGKDYPLVPRTAFYNWLYVNALLEHPELGEALLTWDGFTDIAFNPDKGVNCQAEAAAVYVALARRGLAEECRDFEKFLTLTK